MQPVPSIHVSDRALDIKVLDAVCNGVTIKGGGVRITHRNTGLVVTETNAHSYDWNYENAKRKMGERLATKLASMTPEAKFHSQLREFVLDKRQQAQVMHLFRSVCTNAGFAYNVAPTASLSPEET